MSEWWQRNGNLSQVVSALGAVVFGLGSLLTAATVYKLQDQARREAELGRTADLLMKYQSQLGSSQDDIFHGLGCYKYVVSVSAKPRFETMLGSDSEVPFYNMPPDVLTLDPASPDLARCVEGVDPAKAYQAFGKHFVVLLNLVEAALTGWNYYVDPEPRAEVTKELYSDICISPMKELFTRGARQSPALKKKMEWSYPNLTTFIREECDSAKGMLP